ncbi:MAG: MATE family efflux transporter [Bacillota bacterium]
MTDNTNAHNDPDDPKDVNPRDERSEMLGGMNVRKLLIKLAVPATAAMVFNALYNLVDTIFVGRGAGTIAIGALSIAYPIQLIVLASGLMVGIGSSSVFSRAYGRGDPEAMRKSVNTALLVSVILTVSISGFAYWRMDDLLVWFGATSSNIDYAREYLSYILIALVPYALSIVFNNLTRAEGRPKIAMYSLMIGAGLNIVLDPIFIFDWGLGLGVGGAAMATGISKTISFIYIVYMAYRPDSNLALHLRTIYKVDLAYVKEIIAIGLPSFVRVALGGFLVIIVNNLINRYTTGDPAIYISIYGVINRLIRFSLMPGFGLVQGMVPIVGFNFGAKFYKRLYEVIAYASKLLATYFFSIFVLVLVFAEYLFMLFAKDSDPVFIAEGARAFRIVSLGFVLITFQVILSSVYQAMGYPVRAFFVALSRRFIVFIPAAFVLTYLIGSEGIWWAFFVADFVTGTLSFLVYIYEMRDLKKKIPDMA